MEKEFVWAGFLPEHESPHLCENDWFFKDENETTALIGLRKGSHYKPEQHPFDHHLKILHGKGVISIGGKEQMYGPGSCFNVKANVLHRFVEVASTTVLSQAMAESGPPVWRIIRQI